MLSCAKTTMAGAACAMFLLNCGSRTDLADVLTTGDAPDASPPLDASPHVDATPPVDAEPTMDVVSPKDAVVPIDVTPPPIDAPADVSLPDASCTAAPAGGITVATFPSSVSFMGLAVANGRVFTGTDAPQPTGSGIFETATAGGATQPLMAPSYNFGNVVSDGASIYYPRTQAQQGSMGTTFVGIGPAAIDLATGAVTFPGGNGAPLSASANPTSTLIAATTAWQGMVWIGGNAGLPGLLWSYSSKTQISSSVASVQQAAGLAVDASGIYWGETGDGQAIVVHQIPLGGTQDTLITTAPGQYGVLLGVTSTDVVFVGDQQTGNILAAPKTGGANRLIATAVRPWINASAWVDEPYVYWVESATPTVLTRVSLDGGSPEVVPTQGDVQWLAFDSCNVYVAETNPAQVMALPK